MRKSTNLIPIEARTSMKIAAYYGLPPLRIAIPFGNCGSLCIKGLRIPAESFPGPPTQKSAADQVLLIRQHHAMGPIYSKALAGLVLTALLVCISYCIIWVLSLNAMFAHPAPFPEALQNGNFAFYYHRDNVLYDQQETNNGVPFNTTLVTDHLDNPNNAFYFNGSNSYIQTVHPIRDLTSATFSFWFDAKLTGGYETLLSDADSGSINYCRIALVSHGNAPGIYVVANKNGAGNGLMITNGFGKFKQRLDHGWVNLTWVMSPTRQYVYVNGDDVANVLVTANDVGCHGNGLVIGADDSTYPYRDYFTGAIDDIRIYDRALTGDEVKLLYNLGKP